MRRDRVDAVRDAVLAHYRTPAGTPPDLCIEVPADGAGLVAG